MSCRGQRSLHASIPCEKRSSAAVKGFALSGSFVFSARRKVLRVQPHCGSSSAIHLDAAAASHAPPTTVCAVKPAQGSRTPREHIWIATAVPPERRQK